MSAHVVPVDALVATADGPRFAHQLGAHMGLVVIDRTGRVTEREITEIRRLDWRPVVRVLTDMGELLVEENTVLTTRTGRVFARDLARQVVLRPQPRIEMASPRHLPVGEVSEKRTAYRTVLAHLDPPVVRAPRYVQMERQIAGVLDAAGVPYEDVSDDRWTAMVFESAYPAADICPPSAQDVAIATLTAWQVESGSIVSRTTLEQAVLRRRLLAALVCLQTPGVVKWQPGYRPVEARIAPGEVRSYATAKAVIVDSMPAVEVLLDDEGSLISDLAIVTRQRV